MIALAITLGLTGCLFIAVWLFALEGIRTGDRPEDTIISGVVVDREGPAISFTVDNAGTQAVLLGASLRRRSLRLWRSNAASVSVPRRTARSKLLPGAHMLVSIVEPDERMVVTLTPPPHLSRRQELVVTVGEPDRLRVVHRAVTLPPANGRRPAPAAGRRLAGSSVGTDGDAG